MSAKFEVGFCDVEGTPFRHFRVHAIKMPNGAIYDVVNEWRENCPSPIEEREEEKEKLPFENKVYVEVGLQGDDEIRVSIALTEDDVNKVNTACPRCVQMYGIELLLSRDLENGRIETDFGTVMVTRND